MCIIYVIRTLRWDQYLQLCWWRVLSDEDGDPLAQPTDTSPRPPQIEVHTPTLQPSRSSSLQLSGATPRATAQQPLSVEHLLLQLQQQQQQMQQQMQQHMQQQQQEIQQLRQEVHSRLGSGYRLGHTNTLLSDYLFFLFLMQTHIRIKLSLELSKVVWIFSFFTKC